MINKYLFLSVILFVSVLFFLSCNKVVIHDELPQGEELTEAYQKLLKANKLDNDSSNIFIDIGASFLNYPNNEVEKNRASVYVTVLEEGRGVYKYIYDLTLDKYDSYKVNSVDPSIGLFCHQKFYLFEEIDSVRDSVIMKSGIDNCKISNIRFFLNSDSNIFQIETAIEDVDNPNNSQIYIGELGGAFEKL